MGTKELVRDHKHPMVLILEEELQKTTQGKGISLLCFACRTLVLEFPAYVCNECKILIHKCCAKLPLQVTYSTHREHPLFLAYKGARQQFESLTCCSRCSRMISECLTYRCLACMFYVCVVCGLSVSKDRMLKHEGHPHPLMLVPKEAEFYCDACDMQRERSPSSYVCKTCSFWIDNDCASLQTTSRTQYHDHPLSLAYSLPLDVRHYNLRCDICNHVLDPLPWVYLCGPCRFFIHVRCYRKKSSVAPKQQDDSNKSSKVTKKEHDLIGLPWNDMSVDVIRPFIEKNSQIEIQPLEEIKHFSHEHPLILSSVVEMEKEKSGEERLCDGCVQPISIPYYHCAQCEYLLHINCAHLPTELHHQSHPEHKLSLRKLGHELGYFYCTNCKARSNGFFFECKACHFQLHLNCAILPSRITHEAHHHPLVQKVLLRGHPLTSPCNACGEQISGLIYRCEGTCNNFYLHYTCAMMPRTIEHRWDKHQLTLSYPPFYYHPTEFYCEICEEEIHPKHWQYHCNECDQSFHIYCIPRLGKDCHIKFGHTLQVEDHQHPLKSVREGKYKSKCARCGTNLYGCRAFECEPCRFSFCYKCGGSVPSEPRENGILPGQQVEDTKDSRDSVSREHVCAIL